MDPNWKLMTTEELANQQRSVKTIKSVASMQSKESSLSLTERNKLSTILTPAQIYKIIVCKMIDLLFYYVKNLAWL